MIVAVCSDKGSPGVTTVATALAMGWPGDRLLMEVDPSGGDLVFRARTPGAGRSERVGQPGPAGPAGSAGPGRAGQGLAGELLAAEPGLLTLAADARTAPVSRVLPRYAQQTGWGVPVVAGPPSAHAYQPVRSLWPAVAEAAAGWSGTVFADLGRVQPGHPALPVARAATAVLVVSRVTVEDLYHLRERVNDLAHILGDPGRRRHPVAVVVLAPVRQAGDAVRQVTHMLQAGGSPIPVVGAVAVDDKAAAALRSGQLPRRGARSDLLSSAARVGETVGKWWPELRLPGIAAPTDVMRPAGTGAGTSGEVVR